MKRLIGIFLVLALLCGLTACFRNVEPDGKYKLGDKMDDFTVTLSDGSQTSLYGLLEEKKAVLVNLWASWCSPCKGEFPDMEQAYNEMSDDIGIIALSAEKEDTDEIVLALKKELGLTTLPMGVDAIGLSDTVGINAYPTSIMVDRNGIICYMKAGSLQSKEDFIKLFSAFTSEDYSEPVLLNDIP